MPRAARSFQLRKSITFHVLNRGVLKQPIFHDEHDYSAFLKVLKRYISKFNTKVYHWCLMPNHYHIVMEMVTPEVISKFIGGIQQSYAMKYHRRYKTAGRLFQSRFKSQAIDKELYLLACGRYVERNPLRAGLCQNACEWPWSSARFYAMAKLDSVTSPNPGLKEKSPEQYIEWLSQECYSEEEILRSSKEVIGSHRFQNELLRKHGRLIQHRRGRKRNN
jgi:putative transposase